MTAPIRDPQRLSTLLGRPIEAVHCEEAMGMVRVVALEFAGGMQFPTPPGNALRSAGDLIEIRALLSGISRPVAEALKRRIGNADPETALADAEWLIMEALADPDAALAQLPESFPLARG